MTQRNLHCSHGPLAAMFVAVALLMFAGNAFAVHVVEKVIYTFQGGVDGANPVAGLVPDAAGHLYGTTQNGGTSVCRCGTVFELSPPVRQGGKWTETILYGFKGGASDGATPTGTLIFDKLGNLYGTAQTGGPNDSGAVFELSPPATPGAAWRETVLFIFPSDGSQGVNPIGKLTFDGVGNLYGTTRFGGVSCTLDDCGTVFQLKPPATPGGTWTERVLLTVTGNCCDNIGRDLVFRKGALYDTTRFGGTSQAGTIFQLVLEGGKWNEKILYNFTGTDDGKFPFGGLIADAAGNLFGTADGGRLGHGVIFELSPPAVSGGPWHETTLYDFTSADGAGPLSETFIRDRSDNLYGADLRGPNGAVFKLKAPAISGGTWTEVTLHQFGGTATGDGSEPFDKLILIKNKGLFGTTFVGGSSNLGTVFNVSFVP